MHASSPSSSIFSSALGFLLTAAIWIVLAPVNFGGQATYVIINGNSMEPGLHKGDLVILRQSDTFEIGDVVTYHNPDVGIVIHRIVDRQGANYIFKGDNNEWVDSYQPTRSDLIGKYWLFVPRLGSVLVQLRAPWAMALFVAAIGLALITPVSATQGRKKGQRRRSAPAQKAKTVTPPQSQSNRDTLLPLIVLALASAFVIFYAYSRPITQLVPTDTFYTQRGSFAYSAAAPPGLYSDDRVQTGDPIFRKVINRLDISFTYRFEAEEPGDLTGRGSMDALLTSNSGWERVLPLQAEIPFQGNGTTLQAELDLDAIQRLIDSIQLQTGVGSSSYELHIRPTIAIDGSLGSNAVTDTFAPVLLFQLDSLQLSLARSGGDAFAQLEPAQEGRVTRQSEAPATVRLLVFTLTIATLRLIGPLGLLLACLGIGLVAWVQWVQRRQPEVERIRERYGPLLIAVQNSNLGQDVPMVYVKSMDDLAKIAERSGRMIMCEEQSALCSFSVYEESAVYRYEVHRYSAANSLAGQGGDE